MLCRGVALTWATGWTIDRLYEAGAGETVQLPVLLGLQLGTPQAGAALAAAGCAAASLVVLVQVGRGPGRKGGRESVAEYERVGRCLLP